MELSSSRCHALMTRTSSSSWGAETAEKNQAVSSLELVFPMALTSSATPSFPRIVQEETGIIVAVQHRKDLKSWRKGSKLVSPTAVTLTSKQTQCIGSYNLERHRESSEVQEGIWAAHSFFYSSTSNNLTIQEKGPIHMKVSSETVVIQAVGSIFLNLFCRRFVVFWAAQPWTVQTKTI